MPCVLFIWFAQYEKFLGSTETRMTKIRVSQSDPYRLLSVYRILAGWIEVKEFIGEWIILHL